MSILKKILYFIWHIEWRDFDFDSKKEISLKECFELRQELDDFKGTSVQREKHREEFYAKHEDKVVSFIATVRDVKKASCGRWYTQYWFGIKMDDSNHWDYEYVNCSKIAVETIENGVTFNSEITMRQDFELKAFDLNIDDKIKCTIPFAEDWDCEISLGKFEKIEEDYQFLMWKGVENG